MPPLLVLPTKSCGLRQTAAFFLKRSAGRGHPYGPRPRRTSGNVQHSDDLDNMNFAVEENPLTADELISFRAYSGEPRRRLLNFQCWTDTCHPTHRAREDRSDTSDARRL